MSENLINKLFNKTSCIREGAMFDYIDNKLSNKERHLIEKHLIGCDFCSDALEGLEQLKSRERITMLNNEINNKVLSTAKDEPKVISMNLRLFIGIAAAILLLIGSTFFINNLAKKTIDEGAMAEKLSTPKTATSIDSIDDKLKTKDKEKKDKTESTQIEHEEKQSQSDTPIEETVESASQSQNNGLKIITKKEAKQSVKEKKFNSDSDNKYANATVKKDETKPDLVTKNGNNAKAENKEAASGGLNGDIALSEVSKTEREQGKINLESITQASETRNEKLNSKTKTENEKTIAAKDGAMKNSVSIPQQPTPQTLAVSKNQDAEESVTMNDKNMSLDQMASISYTSAQFPSGADSLNKFIRFNFHYPSSDYSWDKSLGTEIIVEFIINKIGKISNPIIKKGINPALNAEAIRLVKSMPNWLPAMKSGKSISQTYTLPIQLENH